MDDTSQTKKSELHWSLLATYNKVVNHYADLAMSPHTLDHARFMVKQLMREHLDLFGNLGQDVKLKIEEIKHDLQNNSCSWRSLVQPAKTKAKSGVEKKETIEQD